ncbi:MAG: glycosyl transferase family 1 [Micrococcales bacterium 73-15]|uniref:glycosyltransferase family 4 protein n=1 Tax=Salana multivorans TaxID=120377 RepID=UPI000964240A|nr:glycosyltransferase family 4 protein [Salana multivorans]OJX97821.1 MAG: glycosyl transferase family 1 [Micrococcales bacterium 73-15]
MRIVHVSDCFAPRVGGIETQVGDLAAHQARAGHDVHVLTATAASAGTPDRYREVVVTPDGVTVHRIASRYVAGLPVHPRGRTLLARVMAELRPDVVHVQAGVVSPFAFQGARAARAADLPLAITWHCMLDGVERPLRAGARLLGWDGESAALSAVSDVAAARVGEAFPVEGRPAEVGILPNGLDLDAWAPPDGADAGGPGDEDGLPVRPLRIVATQRVAPRKRTTELVDVLAAVLAELGAGAARLTIAGDGPDLARVRRHAQSRGVAGDVDLLGRVPRGELARLYADQDVFLSVARLEAFGIAALEARASGLPVVALDGTGITSFVTDGVDGLIAKDDAGLARAVASLLTTPGLAARLRRNAREHRPAAGWDDVLAAAEREYSRARRLVRFRPRP